MENNFLPSLTELNVALHEGSGGSKCETKQTTLICRNIEKLMNCEGNPNNSTGNTDKFTLEQTLVRVTNGLYRFASVPEFAGREDIGYDQADFTTVTTRAESTLPCLTFLLRTIHKRIQTEPQEKPLYLQSILRQSLLLCGEHTDQHPWTSPNTLTAAKDLLNVILLTTSCASLGELLCDPPESSILTRGMAGVLLSELKPKLQKGIWKQHPSVPWVFRWLLLQIRFPHLSPHLPLVLPPCLVFADDHQVAYKEVGVACLHHVIREAGREELRWYGRGEVVYEAIQYQLYTTDDRLLTVTLPALWDALTVVERLPGKVEPPAQESRYDVIVERLLQSMELESRLSSRRLYTRHLPALLGDMGLSVCRHLARLVAVVCSYLEVYDGPTEEARFGALNILRVLIREAWPRMSHHTSTILKAVLRLVYDLSTDRSMTPPETVDRLVAEAEGCIRLLRPVSGGQVDALIGPVQHTDFNLECQKFAQRILLEDT